MSHINRFAAVVLNPIALALCTSSLGFAASTLSRPATVSLTPSGVPISHDNGVRLTEGAVEVLHVRAIVTDGDDMVLEAPDEGAELADRFSRALSEPAPTKARGPRETKSARAAATKQWVCGAWEDLWQGRGQGRTCEWK